MTGNSGVSKLPTIPCPHPSCAHFHPAALLCSMIPFYLHLSRSKYPAVGGGGGEKGSAVNAAIEMLSDSAMAESMSMRLLFSLVVVDTAERE